MKKVVKLIMQVPGGEQSGIALLRQIVACIGCSRKVRYAYYEQRGLCDELTGIRIGKRVNLCFIQSK